MHKVELRTRSLIKASTLVDSDILHFSLDEALPSGQTLALNIAHNSLLLLSASGDRAQLLMQQQFTDAEISLLLPLLTSFPDYCPYEVLFANFYKGNTEESTVDRARKKLYEALEEGIWDYEMRPLRNALSRTRLKIRAMGLDVTAILETGYILMFIKGKQKTV